MVSYNFPADLVEIQRQYFAADARVHELADAEPSGMDILDGRAQEDTGNRAELDYARG